MNNKKLLAIVGVSSFIGGVITHVLVDSIKGKKYRKLTDDDTNTIDGNDNDIFTGEMLGFCEACLYYHNKHNYSSLSSFKIFGELPYKLTDAINECIDELKGDDDDLKDCTSENFVDQILSDMWIDVKNEFSDIYKEILNCQIFTHNTIDDYRLKECYAYLIKNNINEPILSHFNGYITLS